MILAVICSVTLATLMAVFFLAIIAVAAEQDDQQKLAVSNELVLGMNSGTISEDQAALEFRRFFKQWREGKDSPNHDPADVDGGPTPPDDGNLDPPSDEQRGRRFFRFLNPDRAKVFDGSRMTAVGQGFMWMAGGIIALVSAVLWAFNKMGG